MTDTPAEAGQSGESENYRGSLPDMETKDVVKLCGKQNNREFECYVWKLGSGYQIAVLTSDGEWEIDTTTDHWNPNVGIYDYYRWVTVDDFPQITNEGMP